MSEMTLSVDSSLLGDPGFPVGKSRISVQVP